MQSKGTLKNVQKIRFEWIGKGSMEIDNPIWVQVDKTDSKYHTKSGRFYNVKNNWDVCITTPIIQVMTQSINQEA